MLGMEDRFGKFMDFQGGEYGMAVLSKFLLLIIKCTNYPEVPNHGVPSRSA